MKQGKNHDSCCQIVNGLIYKVLIHVFFPKAFIEQDKTLIHSFPNAMIVLAE